MNPNQITCTQCGYLSEAGDRFCGECGAALPRKITTEVAPNVMPSPAPQPTTESTATEEAAKQKDLSAPLSLGDFMVILLLLCIPVVNVIVLFLWAFDKKTNINRKNFARAGLIYMAISGVLMLLLTLGTLRAMYLDGYDPFEYDPYFDEYYYDDEYYNDDSFDDFYEYFIGNPDHNYWYTLPFDSDEI